MTRREPVTPETDEAVAELERDYDQLPNASDWHEPERRIPDWIHRLRGTGGGS